MGNKMCTCTEERKVDSSDLNLDKGATQSAAVVEYSAGSVKKPAAITAGRTKISQLGPMADLTSHLPVLPDLTEEVPVKFGPMKMGSAISTKPEPKEDKAKEELTIAEKAEEEIKEERGQADRKTEIEKVQGKRFSEKQAEKTAETTPEKLVSERRREQADKEAQTKKVTQKEVGTEKGAEQVLEKGAQTEKVQQAKPVVAERAEQEKPSELEKIIEEKPEDTHRDSSLAFTQSKPAAAESTPAAAEPTPISEKVPENPKHRKYSSMQPETEEKPAPIFAEPDLQIHVGDEELIHFEGELKKYKPGLSKQYILRWCQATPTHLNYYKSHWSANCWLSKPLMSVPFGCIQSIRRVEVKFPIKRRSYARKQPEIYQFEVFLKKDVDVSLLSKSIDYSAYETRAAFNKKRPTGRNTEAGSISFPRTKQGSIAGLESKQRGRVHGLSMAESSTRVPGAAEGRGYRSNRESVSRMTPEKGVREGHLMRTPSTYCKSHELSPNRFRGSMEISTSVEKKADYVEYEGMMFASHKQKQRFELFRKKYEKELQAVVLSEEIGVKNPSSWIPTLSSTFFPRFFAFGRRR